MSLAVRNMQRGISNAENIQMQTKGRLFPSRPYYFVFESPLSNGNSPEAA
jgi:hypothetical protein